MELKTISLLFENVEIITLETPKDMYCFEDNFPLLFDMGKLTKYKSICQEYGVINHSQLSYFSLIIDKKYYKGLTTGGINLSVIDRLKMYSDLCSIQIYTSPEDENDSTMLTIEDDFEFVDFLQLPNNQLEYLIDNNDYLKQGNYQKQSHDSPVSQIYFETEDKFYFFKGSDYKKMIIFMESAKRDADPTHVYDARVADILETYDKNIWMFNNSENYDKLSKVVENHLK